jgi:hypothetical protein
MSKKLKQGDTVSFKWLGSILQGTLDEPYKNVGWWIKVYRDIRTHSEYREKKFSRYNVPFEDILKED